MDTTTAPPPWEPTVAEEAAADARYWDDRYDAEPADDYDTAA
jgi:hypothetical protein